MNFIDKQYSNNIRNIAKSWTLLTNNIRNIIQLLHLNEINMRFYGAEYNNIEWGECRVQYCCTLLHETSYWSSSSVVIVLLHIRLYFTIISIFYENFETFWKFYYFEFFWNIMKFLKVLKFYENLEFEKKLNFKKFLKFWNFLAYRLAKSNFCAIKNHIALSCHVILFIDFAQECITCYLLCMLPPLSGEPLLQRIFIHSWSVVYIYYVLITL